MVYSPIIVGEVKVDVVHNGGATNAIMSNDDGVFIADNGFLRLLPSCLMDMGPTTWVGLLGLQSKFCYCIFSFYVYSRILSLHVFLGISPLRMEVLRNYE